MMLLLLLLLKLWLYLLIHTHTLFLFSLSLSLACIGELLRQLAGLPLFRETYVPMVLNAYGVNQSVIDAVEQVLANSAASVAAGNGSTATLREELEAAGLNSAFSKACFS